MNFGPHMKQLADVLVRVAVRQLTARRAGKEKARAPLTQANGLKRNVPDDYTTERQASHSRN